MDEAMQQSGPIVVRAGPADAAAAAGDEPRSPGEPGGGSAGGGFSYDAAAAESTPSPAARVPGLRLLGGLGSVGGGGGGGDGRSDSPGEGLAR